jgi:hypothetical protein
MWQTPGVPKVHPLRGQCNEEVVKKMKPITNPKSQTVLQSGNRFPPYKLFKRFGGAGQKSEGACSNARPIAPRKRAYPLTSLMKLALRSFQIKKIMLLGHSFKRSGGLQT